MTLTPEQEVLAERVMARLRELDGASPDATHGEIARAIIPMVWNPAAAAERERCLAAVRSERLEEPQPGTSDEAYQQALSDAEAAIRALPSMEADR
jgi:hypothetical protein